MEEDLLVWLQGWYERHCDGEWEHAHGVSVESLDNPGWLVKISLAGTELEDRPFRDKLLEIDGRHWAVCKVRDCIFEGAGGPRNLRDILQVFRAWCEGEV